MNHIVTNYLDQNPKWKAVIEAIRPILLEEDVYEEMAGGKVSYTYQGRTLAQLDGYTDYLAMILPNGVLVSDPDGKLLEAPEEGALARKLKFKDAKSVTTNEDLIREVVKQLINHAKDSVDATEMDHVIELPQELLELFDAEPEVETAFYELSPMDRLEYQVYLEEASDVKQLKTRLEEIIPRLQAGLRLHGDDEE